MIKVVGIGAGGDTLTLKAVKELRSASVVIGYSSYVDLVKDFLNPDAQIMESKVEEIELRVAQAREMKDRNTVVISSGDPMVFGMGSRLYGDADEVIPGITAISLAASLLKIPLDDYAVINASTYSTTLDKILEKLRATIEANFTIGIYNLNPVGRRGDAKMIEKEIKDKARGWNFYIVRNAMRRDQRIIRGKVEELNIDDVDMNSLLVLKRWFR
ncbi:MULTISPECIES: SAM-dependent methyltransferase [Metallosphaera]|uniref:SAM-dependent methyltransferase n=1 Tax=Metallosphaera TaxID=41980 RepID=UPI001F05BE2D|nr:SAM-dependent methyltransferase [Metallosphaera sedula]MCH1770634.1 SAM-dependent methyltransferase [Metallosphaera sedula]MCP6728832.1 SAM-dependent methyltransferase [Metallosphaera sedula]